MRSVTVYDREDWWRLGPSYRRAFKALGCRASFVDARNRDAKLRFWLRSRAGHWLTVGSMALRRCGSRLWNEHVVDVVSAESADLLLVMNGTFVMPETVRALRNRGVWVGIVFADDPFPHSPNSRPELLPVAREADVCFIWSRQLVGQLEEAGARSVTYLPFAWDPEVFPYVAEDPASGSNPGDGPEVVFVGGWDRRRERWLTPVAERFDLEIWGPDYWATRTRRGSPVRECWQGSALRGWEAAEAVAEADIALNVLREQNLPDGTNMRTFEVPGAGGFLLSTRTSGATEIYPEGEAGAYFGLVEEMLEKIDHHLSHPEERRAIARRAHEITVSGHRYVDRARRILEALAVATR